jgi:hypothetical protein
VKRPHRLLRWALIGVTTLVAVLLVLIGLGYLVLPTHSDPKTVTVLGAERWIEQGSLPNGNGWFGSSGFNYSGKDGYPLTVAAGGTFQLVVTFSNFDSQTHEVYSASANYPCSVVGATPSLPAIVPPSEDNTLFEFTIAVPDQPGAQLWVNLTLDALA